MALPSSVPKLQFTTSGVVIPAEADILSGVQADMNAAFGGGLNQALETPQGQLASSHAAIIGDKNNEIAYLVNQVDPQYSDGRFQDAIARIYLLTRKGASATAVIATLTGVTGTVVPAGTLAQDTSGNIYVSNGTVTIGAGGSVDVEFQNIKTGPIPCAAGTLTKVYQAIPGWDAINNVADGTTGADAETRADFEYRRKNSVAKNGSGTPEAIYAEVFSIPEVVDVYVKDNPTGATVNTGSTNYPIIAHSVYVAVVGGADADIAAAIWRKKDLGCDMNGDVSVLVTDDSGYNYPPPSYTIKFERPTALGIKFAVEIVDNATLPSNIEQLVKDAIVARFNGTDGTSRERIGNLILASRYYGAIAGVASNMSLVSVLVGTSSPTLNQVQVGIDQRPTLNPSDITVTLI